MSTTGSGLPLCAGAKMHYVVQKFGLGVLKMRRSHGNNFIGNCTQKFIKMTFFALEYFAVIIDLPTCLPYAISYYWFFPHTYFIIKQLYVRKYIIILSYYMVF